MIRAGKKEDVLVNRLPEAVKSNLESFVNDSTIKVFLKNYRKSSQTLKIIK